MSVSPDDVATTLGVSCPASATWEQWAMWIADAERLINAWANRNGYAYLDPDLTDYVVREAVADRVKRPDSATQVEVAVDDGRVSRRYESATGQIEIRSEWWDLLRPVSAQNVGGAFSIRPAYATDSW